MLIQNVLTEKGGEMSHLNTPSTANAIIKLFDHCKDDLPVEMLNWCVDLNSTAELEAVNIAASLEALATLLACGQKSAILPDDQLASILWGLVYRAEDVAALIRISDDAACLAKEKAGGSLKV